MASSENKVNKGYVNGNKRDNSNFANVAFRNGKTEMSDRNADNPDLGHADHLSEVELSGSSSSSFVNGENMKPRKWVGNDKRHDAGYNNRAEKQNEIEKGVGGLSFEPVGTLYGSHNESETNYNGGSFNDAKANSNDRDDDEVNERKKRVRSGVEERSDGGGGRRRGSIDDYDDKVKGNGGRGEDVMLVADEGEEVGVVKTNDLRRRVSPLDCENERRKIKCDQCNRTSRCACLGCDRCDGRIKTTHKNIVSGGGDCRCSCNGCRTHTGSDRVTQTGDKKENCEAVFHSSQRCVCHNDWCGKRDVCHCAGDSGVNCIYSPKELLSFKENGVVCNEISGGSGSDTKFESGQAERNRCCCGCERVSDNSVCHSGTHLDRSSYHCYQYHDKIGRLPVNRELLLDTDSCKNLNESNGFLNEDERIKNGHCICYSQQTTQRKGSNQNVDDSLGRNQNNSQSQPLGSFCDGIPNNFSRDEDNVDVNVETSDQSLNNHCCVCQNNKCDGIVDERSLCNKKSSIKEFCDAVSNSASEEDDEDSDPFKSESLPLLHESNDNDNRLEGGVIPCSTKSRDKKFNASHGSKTIREMTGHAEGLGLGGGSSGSGRLANNKVGNNNQLENENYLGVHTHSDMENGISVISDRYNVDGVDGGGDGMYKKMASVDRNSKNSLNSNSIHKNKDVPAANNDDADGGDAKHCGCGPMRSQTLHWFRKPGWFVLVITLFSSCQGMAINGFVNTVISTLERRFGLYSTESGLIASCYDIMFVILVIPVSYFGGHGNKPRYLAFGSFVMGLGSFLFCLPHFLSDNYDVSSADETICRLNVTSVDYCEANKTPDLSHYKYFFYFGQMLHGAGATALYTLAAVYVDENVSQRSSSTYNAVFYTGAIIGPAVGYILGGEFLKLYTDMDVDPDTLGLQTNNPKWVGAWWIGFLISGTFACLLSIPLLAFPPSLPGAHKFAEERGKEAHEQKIVDEEGRRKGIKDVILSIRLLLFNIPFMFINFAAAADAVIVSGFSTFLPKFIEYQYGLTSSKAALYVGLAIVPAGGGATFLGGYLVTRFDLKMKGILRMCIVSCCILFLLLFNIFLECDESLVAGVTLPYGETTDARSLPMVDFDDTCNSGCGCADEDYHPMCGRDNVMYFSPCYAGCSSVYNDGESKYYYNCSCVSYTLTAKDVQGGNTHMGKFGKCENMCDWLPLFMVVVCVQMVCLFIKAMPSLTATLRCVPDRQRAFGLGIQWIVARCLGSIPGPIIFGKMFDESCKHWQDTCEGSGSCIFYDNLDMRIYLGIIAAVFAILTLLSFILANWFYTPRTPDPAVHLEVKLDRTSSENTVMTDTQSAPPTPAEAFYHQNRLPPLAQSPPSSDTTQDENNHHDYHNHNNNNHRHHQNDHHQDHNYHHQLPNHQPLPPLSQSS